MPMVDLDPNGHLIVAFYDRRRYIAPGPIRGLGGDLPRRRRHLRHELSRSATGRAPRLAHAVPRRLQLRSPGDPRPIRADLGRPPVGGSGPVHRALPERLRLRRGPKRPVDEHDGDGVRHAGHAVRRRPRIRRRLGTAVRAEPRPRLRSCDLRGGPVAGLSLRRAPRASCEMATTTSCGPMDLWALARTATARRRAGPTCVMSWTNNRPVRSEAPLPSGIAARMPPAGAVPCPV